MVGISLPGVGGVYFLCLSPALPLAHEFWCIKEAHHFSNANGCLKVVSEHRINTWTLRNPLEFLLIQNANNISHCTNNTFISFFMHRFQLVAFYLSCFIKCFLLWFKILAGIFLSDFRLRDSGGAGSLRFVSIPVVFWYECCYAKVYVLTSDSVRWALLFCDSPCVSYERTVELCSHLKSIPVDWSFMN